MSSANTNPTKPVCFNCGNPLKNTRRLVDLENGAQTVWVGGDCAKEIERTGVVRNNANGIPAKLIQI